MNEEINVQFIYELIINIIEQEFLDFSIFKSGDEEILLPILFFETALFIEENNLKW